MAQLGDKPGEAQKPLVPPELIPPSPALTPEEEAKTFQVAPGFKVELVAADPLVGDPVAAQFDPLGRLWVVEMRTYMPDLDGHDEDKPTGQVVILSDTDGDGKMDKREVFLDGLVMPRAICLVGDGALIGAPPMLWYCPDKNHDGKADEKIEVARDFGIPVDPARPELANPERAPNAPLWSQDNWIYCGAYAARFRFANGVFERAVSSFRGQWGLSQDEWGRLYHNSNSDCLRGDMAPSHYLIRNAHYPRPTGANVKIAADQFVWPTRVNPGINRGYRPEMLRDFRLKEFTAACAPLIYRGDLFGAEFVGNAFICEPAGNLIKREILSPEKGAVVAKEAYAQKEFLASTDERFRPVNLTTGPDGALYVVDFYRGVIQHRISLTTYLRQQSEQRGLVDPRGLGRIWRIVPEGATKVAAPRLSGLSPAELVPHLAHANGWCRDTAKRLLVEKADASVVPQIELLARGESALGRVQALWTLDGMRQTRWEVVGAAMADADPRVRNAAVRISEALFTGPLKENAVMKLVAISADEADPQVQLQLALTLGEAKLPAADRAMVALAMRCTEQPYLVDAVLSGAAGRELEMLEAMLDEAKPGPIANRLMAGLGRCVLAERNPARVTALLSRLDRSLSPNDAILNTMAAGAATASCRPVKLEAEPALFQKKSPAVAKLAMMVTWPGKPLPAGVVVPRALTPDEQARFEMGKALFAGVCAACHQPTGTGLEGLAPPLVDSEWVLGSPERVARIALHGVRGPIKVKGATYSLDMPPMGVFGDEQLAAILTYIRREWEHGAEPISPEQVKAIRAQEAKRQDSWTQEELLKLP